MPYTEAQQQAIDHRGGHLQIIACAGSGKTQVLVERILGLLREGAPPRGIVAFTFTEKAAAELHDRVRQAIKSSGLEIQGLVEMYIGTIHGWCLQFMQDHLNQFLKYRVMNEVQTKLLIARNSNRSGLTSLEYNNGTPLRRGKWDVRNYHAMLNILREDELNWGQVPDEALEALDMYRELLDYHAVFDYSELLSRVVDGLQAGQNEWVNAKQVLAERLQYVMVDEYQDVNPIQEKLIRIFSECGAEITVVGDDDQTIYQWRGSAVENILTFEDRYQNVTTVNVTTNFRSTPQIVRLAENVAVQNRNRLDKAFIAGSHLEHEHGDIMSLDFEHANDQADYIAQRIEDYIGHPFVDSLGEEARGLAYSDMAILLRSVRRDAGPIMEALRTYDIPFIVRGVQQLFEQPEIEAARCIFLYIAGGISGQLLKDLWLDADLGLSDELVQGAIDSLPDLHDEAEMWKHKGLQDVFLTFLKKCGLVEDAIPDPSEVGTGSAIYYNLGMFSQVITDFEAIHYSSKPKSKYDTFAYWVEHDAPDYYDEGGLEGSFHTPNAVVITTVHQSKGLQWPVVFIPSMQRNRFPAKKQGGRTVWHLIPESSVQNYQRYVTNIDDERRLFYVAMTRAKKFLYCSFAPGDSRLFQRRSVFLDEINRSSDVQRSQMHREWPEPLPSVSKVEIPTVRLSFSEWKYFSQCPYLFKLRFLYGFNEPIAEALGYGKSLHDALAEIHRHAIDGRLLERHEATEVLEKHIHLPFAYPSLRDDLHNAALGAILRYMDQHTTNLTEATHSEQSVEFSPQDGLLVHGRIDLITQHDTGIVRLIDFKSNHRAQSEEITEAQLNVYAAGYEDLMGQLPDYIEVCNLDPNGGSTQTAVDREKVNATIDEVNVAASSIRQNAYPRVDVSSGHCGTCGFRGICRKGD